MLQILLLNLNPLRYTHNKTIDIDDTKLRLNPNCIKNNEHTPNEISSYK